jgi:hypothetical protein
MRNDPSRMLRFTQFAVDNSARPRTASKKTAASFT